MAFWSSEKLKEEIPLHQLISPYDPVHVRHAAYELRMGPQAFITATPPPVQHDLGFGDALRIPPGQFALLLTHEKVTIPDNAIGFISIRAGIKFRGLVNVSGFHVDPGFSGRLKFSVYNAGSKDIVIGCKDHPFLLWYSDLDRVTIDVYKGEHAGQTDITSEDIMRMQGEVASPADLKHQLDKLRGEHEKRLAALADSVSTLRSFTIALLIAVITVILGALVSVIARPSPPIVIQQHAPPQPTPSQELRPGKQPEPTPIPGTRSTGSTPGTSPGQGEK